MYTNIAGESGSFIYYYFFSVSSPNTVARKLTSLTTKHPIKNIKKKRKENKKKHIPRDLEILENFSPVWIKVGQQCFLCISIN